MRRHERRRTLRRRSRVAVPLGGVLLSVTIVTGVVDGAQADPVYPSQGQVDQANQAANDAKAAVTPAQAALQAAQQHLAQLETTARDAQQRYVAATAKEQAAEQTAVAATKRAHDAAAYADAAQVQLGRLVAAAYRSGAAADLSSLTIVLDVKDPQQYMNGVHVVRRELATQSSIVDQAQGASKTAAEAKTQADQSAAALKTAQAVVEQSAQQAQQAADAAQSQVSNLGTQLDALLAKQQAAQNAATQLAQQRQNGIAQQQAEEQAAQQAQQSSNSGSSGSDSGDGSSGPAQSTGVGVPPYASNIAAQALQYALAQLGKPYVWGGTGPDSFDCSGLAMRAYESAGIDLPHFAAFQYQASHPLSYSQLQPGDLLFWATNPNDSNTIYHEAIYLGSGRMVQAPKTGWNVMISDMWMWGPIQFYARPY
ncbi:MAG TPA: C40 family peptidase [Actinospica sp.]|jgi:cell wall-associated NlpC family hydrolase|nr:C40 family peptidase [Actinospica sp.]